MRGVELFIGGITMSKKKEVVLGVKADGLGAEEIVEEVSVEEVSIEEASIEEEFKLTEMKVACSSGAVLNVRKEPDGEIVRTIPYGEKVQVSNIENGWAQIGECEFVMSKLLK